MVPSSAWGLLLLVWLITPGFLSRTLASQRRPQVTESGFLEASRIMLSSIAFSSIGAVAAWWILAAVGWPLDLAAMITSSREYLADDVAVVLTFLAVQVLIACILVALLEIVHRHRITKTTGQAPATFHAESAWPKTLASGPRGEPCEVWVRLTTGIEIQGMVAGFSHDIDLADRELTLEAPLRLRYPNTDLQPLSWHYVTVQGTAIDFLSSRQIQPMPAPNAGGAQPPPASAGT